METIYKLLWKSVLSHLEKGDEVHLEPFAKFIHTTDRKVDETGVYVIKTLVMERPMELVKMMRSVMAEVVNGNG